LRIALLLAAACYAYGQSPTFEVATIKPYVHPEGQTWTRTGCSGGPGTKDPVRWSCENMGVVQLFQQAYELRPYQVSGADPVRGERYNIVAKIPADTTKEQFRAMQQNLLAERFGLKFHKEPREMAVYELVPSKNGPKLTESAPDTVSQMPDPNSKLTTAADGFPEIPPGRSGMASMGGKTTQRVVRGTMSGLAAMVSTQVGRPVLDKTGLTGKYDWVLKFVMRMGMPAPPPSGGEGPAPPAGPEGPAIGSAIQEQLGLKLESARGMVDVWVIDKFEKKPTEN
jgi:uncharacterized protein (TIGR03435 family)